MTKQYVWQIDISEKRSLQLLERVSVVAPGLRSAIKKAEAIQRQNWTGVRSFLGSVTLMTVLS